MVLYPLCFFFLSENYNVCSLGILHCPQSIQDCCSGIMKYISERKIGVFQIFQCVACFNLVGTIALDVCSLAWFRSCLVEDISLPGVSV